MTGSKFETWHDPAMKRRASSVVMLETANG